MRERKEPEEEETTVDVGLEVENTIPEKIRQLVTTLLVDTVNDALQEKINRILLRLIKQTRYKQLRI